MTFLRCLPLCLLIACSSSSGAGSSEYDPLYDVAPTTADANNAVGLWETTETSEVQGIQATLHLRLEIRATTIKIANRCSADGYETVTVGVTVSSTLDGKKITANDQGGTVTKDSHGPSGKPVIVCAATLTGPGELHYALGAGKLQLADSSFTKVAD